jgi:MFS family permease
MAAYGMGVVVAPILWPTLGGWITEASTWRWVLYINAALTFSSRCANCFLDSVCLKFQHRAGPSCLTGPSLWFRHGCARLGGVGSGQ